MEKKDELGDIPRMVPDRDAVDSHHSSRRAQSNEVARPGHYPRAAAASSWPVRLLLVLLVLAAGGGGAGAWYFYTEIYQVDQRRAGLRMGDLEMQLALTGEAAEETGNDLMRNIERAIEQYDLLWANWRANNRTFEDIQGEIARLKTVNEGQDEAAANTSRSLASTNDAVMEAGARISAVAGDLAALTRQVADMDAAVGRLAVMRDDLASIRAAVSSGDSTVLGLVGRIEYMEESMESVNMHRLQINETLFRMQESVEELQRALAAPGSGL